MQNEGEVRLAGRENEGKRDEKVALCTRYMVALKRLHHQIEESNGCGNVFADLGVPNPEEHLAKSRLVAKISAVIRERGLT